MPFMKQLEKSLISIRPWQLSHVLFDVLGLPTRGLKRTRRGYYSTNAKVLADLASQSKIVSEVLEYRERAKIKSTYLDALPALVLGDGRIHTTFNQTVAATGRLSSSDPNLQNIPTRSELGHRVRKAFNVGRRKRFFWRVITHRLSCVFWLIFRATNILLRRFVRVQIFTPLQQRAFLMCL